MTRDPENARDGEFLPVKGDIDSMHEHLRAGKPYYFDAQRSELSEHAFERWALLRRLRSERTISGGGA